MSLLVLHGGWGCSVRKVQNQNSVYKGLNRKIILPQKRGFNALHRNPGFAQLTASARRISARLETLNTNNLCMGMDQPSKAGQSSAERKTRAPKRWHTSA